MFESLESRQLFSVSAFQAPIDTTLGGPPGGGTTVIGTMGPDHIQVYRTGTGQIGIEVNGKVTVHSPGLISDNVVIEGLGGRDVIDCDDPSLTQTFTIYGGAGHDTIYGGPNADTIYGGNNTTGFIVESADDEIHGNDGDDYLYASYRGLNSLVFGDAGDDTVYGGLGDDVLHGGDGEDQLLGFAGNDFIYGGEDDDDLYGGSGNDYLLAEDGEDWLDGGDGSDVMLGGDDDDIFFGGDGVDYLFGEGGDDVLNSGAGNDVLDGGPGDDDLYQ